MFVRILVALGSVALLLQQDAGLRFKRRHSKRGAAQKNMAKSFANTSAMQAIADNMTLSAKAFGSTSTVQADDDNATISAEAFGNKSIKHVGIQGEEEANADELGTDAVSVSSILGTRVRNHAGAVTRSGSSSSGSTAPSHKILAICTQLGDGDVNPLLPVAAAFAANGWQVHFFANKKFRAKISDLSDKNLLVTHSAQPIQFQDLFVFDPPDFKIPDCQIWPDGKSFFNGMWRCTLLGAASLLESGLQARLTTLNPNAIILPPDALYAKLMGRRLQVPTFVIIPWALGTQLQNKASPNLSPPGQEYEWVLESRHGSNHIDEGVAKLRSMDLWRDIDFDMSQSTLWSDPEYPTFLLTSEEATHPNAVVDFKMMNSNVGEFVFTGPTADPKLVTMSDDDRELIDEVEAKRKDHTIVFFSFGTTFAITNDNLKEMYKHMSGMSSVFFIIAHPTQDKLPSTPDDKIEKPQNVKTMNRVPQIHLLQRVHAFITHGGQNSVVEALVLDVPLVVVPRQCDQPRNAWHIHSYGAGRAIPTPHVVRLQAQEYFWTRGMSEEKFDNELNEHIRGIFRLGPEGGLYKSIEHEIQEKGDFYTYKTTFLMQAIESMYKQYGGTAPEMVLLDDAPALNHHIFAFLDEILKERHVFEANAAKIGRSLMQTMESVGVNGIVKTVNARVNKSDA